MTKHLKDKHANKKQLQNRSEQETRGAEPQELFHPVIVFKHTLFGLFLIIMTVFVGMFAFGSFEIKYHNRFFPGVYVGGQPVGGQTYEGTLNHFKQLSEELKTKGLDLNFESSEGVRKINVPVSTSGLTADNSIEYFSLGDWQKDLQKAYGWGHGMNPIRGIVEQLALLFGKKNFNFSASIQREAVDSLLESEYYVSLKKSVPAEFLPDKNNKIYISEAQPGENVDKEEVLNVLENKLAEFDPTPAFIQVRGDDSLVTEVDLDPFLDFAQSFARNTNIVFQYQGHTWQIKGPKLVTFLTVKEEHISVNREKLENYLGSTVARFIDNPPVDSRFEVRDGKLVETFVGKSGNIVDIDKAVQKIEKIIPEVQKTFASAGNFLAAAALVATNSEVKFNPDNGTIYLPVETIEVEPKITKETIEKYYIKDLVGQIRTSFTGSTADREHNIKIGVAAITGMLIAPGAEFSTVGSIGPVTEKEGYVKELVIKEDRTIKEFGGGLCQVATSLFRLALNAGLPITERQNHRFVVHYYDPPGLDATIYGPHPDLRFVNDTGNYLLLQARVEGKQVIMELYGQKDGRTAKLSDTKVSNKIPAPPTKYVDSAELPAGETKCFEAPHDGLTTDVLYTVNYPDGAVKEKNFRSVYQPWQKICLVGTALPGSVSVLENN